MDIFKFITLWLVLMVGTSSQSLYRSTCAEVKRSFVLSGLGPRRFVPSLPRKARHLEVCPAQNLTCCNKRMEKRYRKATGSLLQRAFNEATSTALNDFSMMEKLLKVESNRIAKKASKPITELLKKLYFGQRTVEMLTENLFELEFLTSSDKDAFTSVQKFFYNVILVMISQSDENKLLSTVNLECIAKTTSTRESFQKKIQDIANHFEQARKSINSLFRVLELTQDAMNISLWFKGNQACFDSVIRIQFCSHCYGLTLIQPCPRVCEEVIESCLEQIDKLSHSWNGYIEEMSMYLSNEVLPVTNLHNSLLMISSLIVSLIEEARNQEGLAQARNECFGELYRNQRSTNKTKNKNQLASVKARKISSHNKKRQRQKYRKKTRNQMKESQSKKKRNRNKKDHVQPPFMMLKEDSSVKVLGDLSKVVLDFSKRDEKANKDLKSFEDKYNKTGTISLTQYVRRLVARLNTTNIKGVFSNLPRNVCTNRSDAAIQVADSWGKCWNGKEISDVNQDILARNGTNSNFQNVTNYNRNNGIQYAITSIKKATQIIEELILELEQSTNSDDPYVEEGQPPAVIGKHPNESVRSQTDLHEDFTTARNKEETTSRRTVLSTSSTINNTLNSSLPILDESSTDEKVKDRRSKHSFEPILIRSASSCLASKNNLTTNFYILIFILRFIL